MNRDSKLIREMRCLILLIFLVSISVTGCFDNKNSLNQSFAQDLGSYRNFLEMHKSQWKDQSYDLYEGQSGNDGFISDGFIIGKAIIFDYSEIGISNLNLNPLFNNSSIPVAKNPSEVDTVISLTHFYTESANYTDDSGYVHELKRDDCLISCFNKTTGELISRPILLIGPTPSRIYTDYDTTKNEGISDARIIDILLHHRHFNTTSEYDYYVIN